MYTKIFSLRNIIVVAIVAFFASCTTPYGGYGYNNGYGYNRNDGYYHNGRFYRYQNDRYYANRGYYYDGRFYRERRLPPGHAKKIYGNKSAKRYAPGQVKKYNKNYNKKYKSINRNDRYDDDRYRRNNKNKRYRDDD